MIKHGDDSRPSKGRKIYHHECRLCLKKTLWAVLAALRCERLLVWCEMESKEQGKGKGLLPARPERWSQMPDAERLLQELAT